MTKGKKDYHCVLCEKKIPKGELHESWSYPESGKGYTTCRAHERCLAVTKKWGAEEWDYVDAGEFKREMEEFYLLPAAGN